MKNRFEGCDISVLITSGKDVVVNNHVTGVNIVAKIFDNLLAHRLQRKGQHWNVLRLLQHPTFGIVNTSYKVSGLIENWGSGGSQQGISHLLGDRFKATL